MSELFRSLFCPEWLTPLVTVDVDFKEKPCPTRTLSIIAFSEAGFRAGIPRILFLAKLCLEQCLEGRARVSRRSRCLLAPQPCFKPCPGRQSLGVHCSTPGTMARPHSALVGRGVSVSGLLWWCHRLLKNLEPAWRAHSPRVCEISNQTPPRHCPSVILMASENQYLLQNTAFCRKAVRYVPHCWYRSPSPPGACKEWATSRGCAVSYPRHVSGMVT